MKSNKFILNCGMLYYEKVDAVRNVEKYKEAVLDSQTFKDTLEKVYGEIRKRSECGGCTCEIIGVDVEW